LNWFKTYTTPFPGYLDDNACEHVIADPSVFYTAEVEIDSFGIVGSRTTCKACRKTDLLTVKELDLVNCKDCCKPGICSSKWYEIQAERNEDSDTTMVVNVERSVWDMEKQCYFTESDPKEVRLISMWRWFDFYAPQGDEELPVCSTCWNEPKHKQRLAEDERARKDEDAYYDDDKEVHYDE